MSITQRLLALLAALLLCLGAGALGWFQPADQQLQSLRFEASARPASGELVFVEIDADSLAQVGRWPWPRSVYARLLDALMQHGADDVVFDIDFSTQSTPSEDDAFAAALDRAGGYARLAAFAQTTSSGQQVLTTPLPRFAALADPVLVNVDGDGTGLVESFPAGLADSAIPPLSLALTPGVAPIAPAIVIDYGVNLASIKRLRAIDVLNGNVDPALLAGRQIIVGASAVELKDMFRVPRFGVIPGPLVQIAAAETIKANRQLVDLGAAPAIALAGGALALLILWGRRLSLGRLAGLGLLASVGVELAALLALKAAPYVVDTMVFHAAIVAGLSMVLLDERAIRWRKTRQQQSRLAYLARHDTTSGALSRQGMIDILEQRARTAPPLILVAAQFPRLSQVVATLGHEVAELVARAITDRLHSMGNVLPTRLGSDVFAFVLPQVDASQLIQTVAKALEEPYRVEGHTIVLYLVLGITTSATAADDPAELMRQAEVALRVASQRRLALAHYDPAMSRKIKSRRLLDLALHQALEHKELQLVFQPQVCLKTGRLLGAEALVRWHSAEHGDVSPAQFIPLAEESSLIAEIGTWVMREACRQAVDWPWQGRLSVNVSAMQFRHGDLLADVTQALADSGFPADRLDIEITESLCTQDDARTLQTLQALRDLGCSIAMDDFGTGYSSLSYLAHLPIDKIKIDQSFIRGLPALDSQVLVETAVSLGQRLGKVVIAEGVETDAQRAYLSSIGCDLGQGYYFGRPGPAAELPFERRFAA